MSKSKLVLNIASERIELLFALAAQAAKNKRKDLSSRYIKIARDISSHYKVTIPNRLKRLVCRNCGELQISGANSNVTIASSKGCVIYKCKCGTENKIFYRNPTSRQA